MSEEGGQNAPDFYVQQLHEVFLSCDSSGSGFLSHDDLLRLCDQLNIDPEMSRQIITSLHMQSSPSHSVSFDQFKATFVSVLTEHDVDGDHNNELKSRSGLENTDLSEEERHVHALFAELGVGENGYVTKDELQRICQYLKMAEMSEKELDQLFYKLDVDGDGLLNFAELFHGLFETDEVAQPEPLETHRIKTTRRMLSLPLNPSYGRPLRTSHFDQRIHGWEGVCAFLDRDGLGYANSDFIINLWESFGISDGHVIIKLLRFDEKKPISLRDLSMALMDEVHCFEVDNNILYQAALSTMEHALDYLHCMNEDLKHERDRMSNELTKIRSRNVSLVNEFDDAYASAEVDNIQKQQLAEQTNQSKYQEMIVSLKQEVTILNSKIEDLEKEKAVLGEKLSVALQKLSILEAGLMDKEPGQEQPSGNSTSNKAKSDHWTKEKYETELYNLMRGISMERKDIEGTFRIEIDELEQRHQLEIKTIREEFREEKDELIASNKRLLENALAERERDLLTEFSKEMVQRDVDAETKLLRDQLETAEENARLKAIYIDDLERKLKFLELQHPEETKRSEDDEAKKEREKEEESKRKEQLLQERFEEEKLNILNQFHEEISTIHEEHRNELLRYETSLNQKFNDEKKIIEASTSEQILQLETKVKLLRDEDQQRSAEIELLRRKIEKGLLERENEKDVLQKEFEQDIYKKTIDLQLYKKEMEQELSEKDTELKLLRAEKEKYKREIEQLLKKETVQISYTQQFENKFKNVVDKQIQCDEGPSLSRLLDRSHEQDTELKLLRAEKEKYKKEIEQHQLKKETVQTNYKQHFENKFKNIVDKQTQCDEGPSLSRLLDHSHEQDVLLRLQIDELCRNNVRLKDELEKKEEDLLKLQESLESKQREQIISNDSIIVERDRLKKQLQLTVNELSEATSALSLMSHELSKEKDSARTKLNHMVDSKCYDEVLARFHHAEARTHHLQHSFDLKVAETTKLLNLSKVVSKQMLDQMTEDKVKLESQVERQKILINDQLLKILKQTDDLVKSDLLIHDLYVENSHLLKCLQKTEGQRQSSDYTVQNLEDKCLNLSNLFHMIGNTAIRH